jgi:superfamily II DNA or RNA helicase
MNENIFSYLKNSLKLFNVKYKEKHAELKDMINDSITINKIMQKFSITKLPYEIEQLLYVNNDNIFEFITYIEDTLKHTINDLKKDKDTTITIINSKVSLLNEPYITIIYDYLKQNNFIDNFIDYNVVSVLPSTQDIKNTITCNLDVFIPRINQYQAFNLLEKHGIKTGIHCQATGCGKTFIILKYIDYFIKHNTYSNIILFTERVNILADLFNFKKNESIGNIDVLKKWKQLGICDLLNITIINRVTIKKKDWCNLIKNNNNKHQLIVINRAFLTNGENYKTLTSNTKSIFVLHDECHNTTSVQCFKFLSYCKTKNIPIVGFSATPLRTGKNDLNKLKQIYNTSNEDLNLLTNFNMIYAIEKNLILPPRFYWYSLNEDILKKNTLNNITECEIESVFSILREINKQLPYKKIIAWCGKISLAEKWYSVFKEKMGITEFKDFSLYLDTSMNDDNDYIKFKSLKENGILFCAAKHREGSDIPNLDCCIFLDKVKNRGAIPFIQSIGRVLRLNEPKKEYGYIIDYVYNSTNSIEKEYIEKIIGYYLALDNATLSNDIDSKYDKYIQMRELIYIDKDTNEITLKLNDNKTISINLMSFKWDNLMTEFDKTLQLKIKVSSLDNLKYKCSILKTKFGFNTRTDFVKEYNKIKQYHTELNLPDLKDKEYTEIFNTYSWFKLLDIEHEFLTSFQAIKTFLKNNNESLTNCKANWDKWCSKYIQLPPYPNYIDAKFSFNNLEERNNMSIFI